MISLVSISALFALGNSQSVSCDTATPVDVQDVTSGNSVNVDLLIDENGLFFFSGCDTATNVDFSLQILQDDGVTTVGDPCPGTAACTQPEGCFEEFTGIPPNFEGFIQITNTGPTDGQVQVLASCSQTTMAPMTTMEMVSTMPTELMSSTTDSSDSSDSTDSPDSPDSSDSTDSPDSSDSTDSPDSPDSSDSTDSPDSLESSDSPSDDNSESASGESSEESVSVNGGLIEEEESPETGEADANGRSVELNAAAAGQAANGGMPFWQWVWIIVAVFVLLNFGLCYWLYTLRQTERKSRVSFDATAHDDLRIEME